MSEQASDKNDAAQDNSAKRDQAVEPKATRLGDLDEDTVSDINKQRQIELEEEMKLKARHPCIQRPGSEFLQKRLQRGQKYFDSGDYNMAKASTNPNTRLPDGASPVTAIDGKILNKQRH